MNERDAIRDAVSRNPKRAREFLDMVKSGKIKVGDPDPNEPLQVLCMRWPGMVDGSAKEQCTYCSYDVALAPSTQAMVAAHTGPVEYMCMECAAVTLTEH